MKKLNRLYLGTNTKMYKTIAETTSFLTQLRRLTEDLADSPLTLFVIPSFTTLESANRITSGSHIRLGAQNMCWEDQGQFTGEISPVMLKEVGVSVVEIGHSERRHVFRENDFDQEKKTAKAAQSGFTPLLCIGETLTQREQGITIDWVRKQVKIAFQNVTADQAKQAVIAYEPIWAIGTGKTATTAQAEEVCGAIRACIGEIYDEATKEAIRIQYGGSVNAGNAAELFAEPDIDGGLVGGASLKAEFGNIVNYNK